MLTAQNSATYTPEFMDFRSRRRQAIDTPLVQPVAAYILPDQARSWSLAQDQGDTTSAAAWRRLRLKVTTEDGESEIELDTTGE